MADKNKKEKVYNQSAIDHVLDKKNNGLKITRNELIACTDSDSIDYMLCRKYKITVDDIDKETFIGDEIKSINGCNNLIMLGERTLEERHILATNAGKRSGEVRQQQKHMKEIAKKLLAHDMDRAQIEEALGTAQDLLDGDKTVAAVLTVRMIQEAAKGNYKAFETLRDTAGYKPKDEVDITADIMTEADRSLVDKVSSRLGIKDA